MAKVEADIRDEIDRARRGGFTAEELAAGKAGYLAEQQLRRARDGSIAGKLTHYLYTGRTFAWDEALEARVAALTAAELQAALERHVDPARLVLVKAGDFAHAAAKPAAPPAPSPGRP
jgi:zinc protease